MNPELASRLSLYADLWCGAMWRACWQGALFIGVVWIICRLSSHLSLAVRPVLWLLACLKLLLSLACLTPIALPLLPSGDRGEIRARLPATTVAVPPVGDNALRDLRQRPRPSLAARPAPSPGALLCAAWCLGVLSLCVLRLLQAMGLRRLVQRAESLTSDELCGETRLLGAALGLRQMPRLRQTTEVTAPLVLGLWRPVVLLPVGFASTFTARERRMALTHELTHIRRRDLWLALVPGLTHLLFFFFPPAWLACREWATAREAACDAETLRIAGVQAGAYARMLLKLIALDSAPAPRGALGATASYHTLRYRLRQLRLPAAPARPAHHAGALLLMPCALIGALPIVITSAAAILRPLAQRPRHTVGIDRIPAQELRAGGDPQMHYLLIGPKTAAPPPPEGYRLLLVLPGGDGGPDFRWFVKRIADHALPDDYLAVELIAPQWTPEQAHNLVWPTRLLTMPEARFSTEEFIESVVRDVRERVTVDRRFIFTLGWASSGPACYAAALEQETQVTGSFIAMSVYHSSQPAPDLRAVGGRALYLLQPTDAAMAPLDMAQTTRDRLQANGATVELATYAGGYGWHGPVYQQIERGIDWLERHHADAPKD
jgi:beta-lactamase regulating signal transducer with metallopeptidase domain/predicted esterase